MNNIAEQICEAVDIIVSQKIAKAGYDRTIQATVLSCLDSVTGKYKVKYQNSSFIAYAANPSIRYQKDALVYILIPGNDMSRDKIIMNSVDKSIFDYTNTIEDDNRYQVIGGDAVLKQNDIEGLCSYKEIDGDQLYHIDNEENTNIIEVNNETLIAAIKEGGYFKIKMTIQTALDTVQQSTGQYGLSFVFLYENGISETITFPSSKMNGNPYSFPVKQEQALYIPVNNVDKLISLQSISTFSKGFPLKAESKNDDIFISDIELYGAKPLTEKELSSITLSLVTGDNIVQKTKDWWGRGSIYPQTLTMTATLKVNGQETEKEIECYWFKENLLVNSEAHDKYNNLCGIGWECLNSKDDNGIWAAAGSTYSFSYTELTAYNNKYKCIARFKGENITYESEEVIYTNTLIKAKVSISSDLGTAFYNGQGQPVLSTELTNISSDGSSLIYVWKSVSADKTTKYYYSESDINDGAVVTWNSSSIQVNAQSIMGTHTYYCYVYNSSEDFIGYGSIVLQNTVETTSAYFDIVLHNANQVFIYDKYNLSPLHSSLDFKQSIPTISFDFYDDAGQIIPLSRITSADSGGKIKWKVPKYNSMISAISSTEEDDYYVFTEEFLNYSIQDRYDKNRNNNTIVLEVTYQDVVTRKEIELTFIKDNDMKDNGTDTLINIDYLYGDNSFLYYYSADNSAYYYTVYHKEKITDNFYKKTEELDDGAVKLFNPQLWKSGEKMNLTDIPIQWKILKDSNGVSCFIDDNGDGFVSVSPRSDTLEKTRAYSHIVRASFNYQNQKYFIEIPMITIDMHSIDYQISLKPNTGYQKVKYDRNGKNPSYDNTYPFEILVGKGGEIQSASNFTYEWQILGDEVGLYKVQVQDNKGVFAPLDSFNGNCYNIALCVHVSLNDIYIGNIHIPIYLYLDREDAESIDEWDGNRVLNGSEIIITPTGYTALDNAAISGVLLGQIKNGNSLERGLFAYSGGTRILTATPAQFLLESKEKNLSIDLISGILKYSIGTNFSLDENGVIQALTLGDNVQIDSKNINSEISDSNSGLGKILSKYVLVTTYEKRVQSIESTHANFISNTYNPTIQSINQTLSNHGPAIDKLEDDVKLLFTDYSDLTKELEKYVTISKLSTILGVETLDGYTLANTLSKYATKENLKDYVTATNFKNLLNISEDNTSIAPIISGGEIAIETFMVDSTGEVAAENATITNLVSSNYKWENVEDAEDTLDLIEEIKALKEEIAALKEQLEGTTPTE